MSETLSNNQEEPIVERSKTDQLVEQATTAFTKHDIALLDKALLELGQELGVELETPYDEMLKANQTNLDFLFGKEKFNLKQEYIQGNIKLFSVEQEKALKKEGYTERLIVPGSISRNEIISTVNQKYQEKYHQEIWYSDRAKEDINNTQAAKKNPRPEGFYTIALKLPKETVDAHPETVSKTLAEQLGVLQQEQSKHPKLNLKGMTLPEAMLFDSYILPTSPNQEDHADNSQRKWSYNRCLEEVVLDKEGNPARALLLLWNADYSQLEVPSIVDAHVGLGSRLAALPAEAEA